MSFGISGPEGYFQRIFKMNPAVNGLLSFEFIKGIIDAPVHPNSTRNLVHLAIR